MIIAENVTYTYSYDKLSINKVLKNINLNISKGEFVAILGRNGSGKSTLAKHFNAVLKPQNGRVIIKGMDTRNDNELWNIRSSSAMIFQNPDNQIVATVVEEDVAFAAENLGIPAEDIRKRVNEALEIVGMTKYRNHAPHLLSGGQKQRVAIAGVVAMRPDIIIFDEPTAMLDPQGRKDVMKCIRNLNEKHGITIVLITHNMDEAVLAHRVAVIDRGSVVMDAEPKEVFSNVEQMQALGLDVPQVTRLTHLLREKGIDLPRGILTVDECIRELSRHVHNC